MMSDLIEPIEHDEAMGRDYIPLPGGWEVQTQGKGSTFRILDRNTGERLPIVGDGVAEHLTKMAHDIRAAYETALRAQQPQPIETAPRTDDKRVAEIRAEYAGQAATAPLYRAFYAEDVLDLLTALDATTARLREAEGLLRRANDMLKSPALGSKRTCSVLTHLMPVFRESAMVFGWVARKYRFWIVSRGLSPFGHWGA
jgi:hypothetical protein